MVERDYEASMDEMERSTLQKAISDVERQVAAAAPGSKSFFEIFLQNAKGRVEALDKKIKDGRAEREAREKETAALVQMVEREKALSASEKETFGGFLKKEFFTKSDFSSLEQFYSKTWDRLSDEGKDAMSHRIWEGIRKDQYTFTELPKPVQEKELEQVYRVLKPYELNREGMAGVGRADCYDFVRAYESGHKDEAARVLERHSFKKEMFQGVPAEGVQQVQILKVRAEDKAVIKDELASASVSREPARATRNAAGATEISSEELEPLASSPVAATTLPDLNASRRTR